MANKKWGKLPRNIIYSEEFQDVLKELPEELIYKAHTFLLSCYCNADDDGCIDITDTENYAKKIFLTPEELRILIVSFCRNGILHSFCLEMDGFYLEVKVYSLCNWELPEYKNSHKKESLEERRKRIAQWSEVTSEGYPPPENYTIKVKFI